MPRVFLHIGVPKTGTTYLQDLLFRHRKELAKRGYLYPGAYPQAHFDAAVDLREMAFGGHADPGVAGRWDRIARSAASWRGTAVVVSHELLAGANQRAVTEAVRSLAGHEVHAVVTARDLGRQVPAMWQEYVKNHGTVTFAEYAAQLTRTPRQGREAKTFWRQQHLVEVLRRWAEQIPDDRMHVVTVPPPGAEPRLLWERFCAATTLPAEGLDPTPVADNSSLGFAEAELLRRVNITFGDGLDWPSYEATVKSWFAEQVLAGHDSADVPGLPVDRREWFEEQAATMVDDLKTWGLPVSGDLADLRPRWADATEDNSPDAAVLQAAVVALASVLTERAGRHWTGRQLRYVARARRSPLVRRLPDPVQRWLRRLANG